MLRFHAAPFLEISKSIAQLQVMLNVNRRTRNPEWNEDSPFLIGEIDGNDICSRIKAECEKIELKFSAQKADWILTNLKAGKLSFRQFGNALEELDSRVSDELGLQSIYRLTRTEHGYFESVWPFGGMVMEKLPDTDYDLKEASKCLALERPTAAVMHLQRAMEIVLKEFGKPLGVDPDTCMGWGDFLRKVTDGLNAKFGTKGEKWRERAPVYDECLPFLLAIKSAWRDPSMHVRGRYNFEEAEAIFNALKGFTQKVAESLPIAF